jgi:hypothetical protein
MALVAHAGSASAQDVTQEKLDGFMAAFDKLASFDVGFLYKLPPLDWKRAFDKLRSFNDGILQETLKFKYVGRELVDPMTRGRESLKYLVDLDGVRAFVSPDLKECGVTEEMVKTRAELRLRQSGLLIREPPHDPNGFRAWMSSHLRSTFNMAGLFVSMESISLSKPDIMAVDVKVCQSQIVNLLSADRPTFMLVYIWEHGQDVIGSRQRVVQGCWEAMNELLDMYCNDWLATHPTQKPQTPNDPNNNQRSEKKKDD